MTQGYFSSKPVRLTAGGRSCLIEAVRDGFAERLVSLTQPGRGLILLDQALAFEKEYWVEVLPGFSVIFAGQPGEAAKNLDEARRLWEIMARANLARDDWFIVRGGGSLTDLGAFCGGLYRRGLRLILAPTTLVAAVDAAVGGKTALNFAGAKNQLGHFYLPEYVLADLSAFASLAPEQLADGLAEAYKTGLLLDQKLAALVETGAAEFPSYTEGQMAEIVHRSQAAKAALVADDFFEEKGRRDILNLGHTFGHAVESYYTPILSHGRAVAWGLAVMAEISLKRGLLHSRSAGRIQAVAGKLGGPWPELPPDKDMATLLGRDKKIRKGELRFVALSHNGPLLLQINAAEILQAARAVGG